MYEFWFMFLHDQHTFIFTLFGLLILALCMWMLGSVIKAK